MRIEDLSPEEIAEAKAVIMGGLGRAELEFVGSLVAPLFWILKNSETEEQMIKSGSMFFLNTGNGPFAVTAAHVVQECSDDSKLPTFFGCAVGCNGRSPMGISIGDRLIDANADIDIATLRFTKAEVEHLGRTVLTGIQPTWPPRLPEADRGVTYAGFPGVGRRWLAKLEISFGLVAMAGVATVVDDTKVSVLIEREHLHRVPELCEDGAMPTNFDFGGISGGPMLAIYSSNTIRSWFPAGVIIEGPNPSGDPSQSIDGLEIITARPIHFIRPDGTLDVERWQNLHPFR